MSPKIYADSGICKVDDPPTSGIPSGAMAGACVHCGQVHGREETCPQLKRAREKRASDDAVPIEIADTKPAPISQHAPTEALFLGRYRMEQKLGEGGMGEVWKAWEVSLRRFVAIKRMLPKLAARREFVERFESEAALAASIDHRNVVTIYERGRDGGTPYFIMELVKGRTLREEMEAHAHHRLPVAQALDYTVQILEALVAAHRKLIIHRDLKPSNVMLVRDVHKGKAVEEIKILDFGIAKLLDGEATELTVPGPTPGTPPYQAPELLLGEKSRKPSIDLYAVGVMLYEMLAGKLPWQDGQAVSAARKAPPSVRETVPDAQVPPHVDQAIRRALSFEADARFASADEFIAALAKPDVQALPPGLVVDEKYQIDQKIGEGGHAVVYKAREERVDRWCAIKFLKDPAGADDDLLERFSRDAKLAASVQHPNVVQIFGAGDWNGFLYVAMEFVDGATLRAKWHGYGWGHLLEVIRQLAEALTATHAAKILHRDIAPENVLVDRTGMVKLIDFGIARPKGSDLTNTFTPRRLGRYGYMAPEQARDPRRIDERTDQWSLAALIYEALTGIQPYCDDSVRFDQKELLAFTERLLSGNPPAIVRAFNETVPSVLEDVVMRGLAFNPEMRFPTLREFVAALADVPARNVVPKVFQPAASPSQTGGAMAFAVEPKTRQGRSRAKAAVAITGAIALAAAAAGVAFWHPFSKREHQTSTATSQPPTAVAAPREELAAMPNTEPPPPLAVTVALRANVDGAEALVEGERVALPTTLSRPKGARLTASVERPGYKPELVELIFDGSAPTKVVELSPVTKPKKARPKKSPYDRPLFQESERTGNNGSER